MKWFRILFIFLLQLVSFTADGDPLWPTGGVDRNTSHVISLLHSAHTEWCTLTSWLKKVFVRITSYSWSFMCAVDWAFVLSLFLALFLSVCLSYPLLFSFHFYLNPVLNLFLHVDDAKANIPCAFAKWGVWPPGGTHPSHNFLMSDRRRTRMTGWLLWRSMCVFRSCHHFLQRVNLRRQWNGNPKLIRGD